MPISPRPIYGVDRDTQAMSDDLARQGCIALAQNFFWRDQDSGVLAQGPEGGKRARARAGRIDFAKAMSDLQRSIAEVKRHPQGNGKIVVFGYCFGGAFVWRAACDGLVDAGVSFHGTFLSKSMKPSDKPRCPVSLRPAPPQAFALAPPKRRVASAVSPRRVQGLLGKTAAPLADRPLALNGDGYSEHLGARPV